MHAAGSAEGKRSFPHVKQRVETDGADATRATARLPGVDIEIVHRRAVEDDAEYISINLRASPSFEAFAHVLEGTNPFTFWAQAAQLAWQPWISATKMFSLPWTSVPPSDTPTGPKRIAKPKARG
jgi:hypothetical protein